MQKKEISLSIETYQSASELSRTDADLIKAATDALDKSYSPYSGFKVACAALLQNGATVSGANQENASYPVCVCAEVVTLSTCATQYPGVAIQKLAIATRSEKISTSTPKAPCGQCRQTIVEFENRFNTNIEIIMCGQNGQVYKVHSAKDLLPLYFSGGDL